MPGSRTSPSSRSHLCWAHGSLTAITPGPGSSSWPWEGSRSLPWAEQAVLDVCWALKGGSAASCSPQHSRTAPLMDLLEPLLILHFAGTEPEGREAKFSQQVGICFAGMGGKKKRKKEMFHKKVAMRTYKDCQLLQLKCILSFWKSNQTKKGRATNY